MKTLSKTGAFIVLAVIAIVATVAFRAFSAATPTTTPCSPAFTHPKKIVKEIGGPGPNNYAELKNPDGVNLDNALNTLKKNGGQYCIRFLSKPSARPEEPYKPHHLASIKTDKVTKSEVANTTATDASAANDPNVVYRITSDYQKDIDGVTTTLK
jgi:hypothetical protein